MSPAVGGLVDLADGVLATLALVADLTCLGTAGGTRIDADLAGRAFARGELLGAEPIVPS